MKKCSLFALLVIPMMVSPIVAQERGTPDRTSAPPDARYEIVQSSLAVKVTLRLDKYTGDTYQLVVDKDGEAGWQIMPREKHTRDTVIVPGKVNYQIFTSGVVLRHTFLMNVNTGATWQFFLDEKEKYNFWGPIF